MSDLTDAIKDMLLPKCPQCGSRECGPIRCRFSGMSQDVFRENQYAESMIRREQQKPKWLRDLLTGARDIPNGQ